MTGIIDGFGSEPHPPSLGKSIQLLRRHRDDLVSRGLLNIAIFGSVARGEEGPGNDTDLLVKVAGDMNAFRLAALQTDLAEILGTTVEIMTLVEFNAAFDRAAQEDVVVAY
ncbi:MAG: nucleotidyltransferase domain-containing protein [Alphaproteobacteria bacterium]